MYSCMLLRRCLAWQHMVGYMQEYACHVHFLFEVTPFSGGLCSAQM